MEHFELEGIVKDLLPKSSRVSDEWDPRHQIGVTVGRKMLYLGEGVHPIGSHTDASVQLSGEYRFVEGLLFVPPGSSSVMYLPIDNNSAPLLREYLFGEIRKRGGTQILVSSRKGSEPCQPIELSFNDATSLAMTLFSYENDSAQRPNTRVSLVVGREDPLDVYMGKAVDVAVRAIGRVFRYASRGAQNLYQKVTSEPDPAIRLANEETLGLPIGVQLRLPLRLARYKLMRNRYIPTS